MHLDELWRSTSEEVQHKWRGAMAFNLFPWGLDERFFSRPSIHLPAGDRFNPINHSSHQFTFNHSIMSSLNSIQRDDYRHFLQADYSCHYIWSTLVTKEAVASSLLNVGYSSNHRRWKRGAGGLQPPNFCKILLTDRFLPAKTHEKVDWAPQKSIKWLEPPPPQPKNQSAAPASNWDEQSDRTMRFLRRLNSFSSYRATSDTWSEITNRKIE